MKGLLVKQRPITFEEYEQENPEIYFSEEFKKYVDQYFKQVRVEALVFLKKESFQWAAVVRQFEHLFISEKVNTVRRFF